SRRTPLQMVVHPQGEAKALAAIGSSPTVPTIRYKQAIRQLPDLGLNVSAFPTGRPKASLVSASRRSDSSATASDGAPGARDTSASASAATVSTVAAIEVMM